MDNYQQNRLKQLEKIVVREQDKLFKFAYLRVGVREDAEDLVQNVFLKLFKSEENLKMVRQLDRYLFRSLHNLCTDYLRKKTIDTVPIEEAGVVAVDDADDEMHQEFLRINALMKNLSPEQQEVVRLKCTDHCKFSEIAHILNIPVATAKSRYRYAIHHLQNLLLTSKD